MAERDDDLRAAHEAAPAAGADGYPDPRTGYWVFTAAYLASRYLLRQRLPPLPLRPHLKQLGELGSTVGP